MSSPSRSSSLTLGIRGVVLMGLVAMQPTASSGLTLVSSDATAVAQFQAGATVEGFDDLSALTITSYDDGQIVPAANRFSSRNLGVFTSPFFNSGGASFNDPVGNPGTPIGIFDPDGAIAGDVKSPNNVAGPLVGDGSFEAFNNGFMEVIFPADVIRVGFWITQGSSIHADSQRLQQHESRDRGRQRDRQCRPVHRNPTRYGRRPGSDDRLRPGLHDRRLHLLDHADSGTVEFRPDRDGIDGSGRLAARPLTELPPGFPLDPRNGAGGRVTPRHDAR